MDLKFRNLQPDEIEVRVGQVTKGGVNLLLYKNARIDQKLLDETVGPCNWQKHYSRENANCIVSIWDPDKAQWIEKEDVGTDSQAESEKGRASDSFKRACVSWGIGRELYTAPKIFIKKDFLPHFSEDGGKCKCNDSFELVDVQYFGEYIAQITIQVSYYGKNEGRVTFTAGLRNGSAPLVKYEKPDEKAPAEKSEPKAPAPTKTPAENAETATLEEMYELAPKANTSVEGVNEWIRNQYDCEATDLTPEQIAHVCKALKKQIARNNA